MIRRNMALAVPTLMALSMTLVGCEAIKGIFKAGVWVGVIAVVLLVGLVAMLARTLSPR